MPPFKTLHKSTSVVLEHMVDVTSPKPFNMLLFGAPGVGKGTFGKLIARDFKFKPFSMGDYFRKVTSDQSQNDEFTQQIRDILRSGKLVDD